MNLRLIHFKIYIHVHLLDSNYFLANLTQCINNLLMRCTRLCHIFPYYRHCFIIVKKKRFMKISQRCWWNLFGASTAARCYVVVDRVTCDVCIRRKLFLVLQP